VNSQELFDNNNNPSIHSPGEPSGREKSTKKWAKKYAERCENRLPSLQIVFSRSVVEDQVGKAMMTVFAASVGGASTRRTVRELSLESTEVFMGLKVSKKLGDGKEIWTTAEGKVQSKFRRELAYAALGNVQRRAVVISSGPNGSRVPESAGLWYNANGMSRDVIDVVHNRKENGSRKKRRGLRDGELSGEQILEYASEFLYKTISTVLIRSRRRSDDSIFAYIGYLFVDWRLYPVEVNGSLTYVDQGSLKFRFSDSTEGNDEDVLVGEIPGNPEGGEWERGSDERLRSTKVAMSRYNCVVEHDVMQEQGGIVEKVRTVRNIDFMNMAMRYLVTFAFGTDEKAILQHTRVPLRSVCVVALILQGLTRRFAEGWEANGSGVFEDIGEIKFGKVPLIALLPGDYRKRSVIRHGRCLRYVQ